MLKIDEKDIKILRCIDEVGNSNIDEIAKMTNISRSTIHYRLKKYQESGIIKGTLVDLDPIELGLDITAIILVNAVYEKIYAEELGEKLSKIPGVISVYYVLGGVDFILICKAMDREDLKRVLRDINSTEGVIRTGTHFVAATIKEEKRILVNYPEEMLKKLFYSKLNRK
jgi:DNA-binding Lrp family transcriptional regulator